MARDRKRAKQRQQRRARPAVRRSRRRARRAGSSARGRAARAPDGDSSVEGAPLPHRARRPPRRARPCLGDVDEFDAALVRGAGGVPASPGLDLRGCRRSRPRLEHESSDLAAGRARRTPARGQRRLPRRRSAYSPRPHASERTAARCGNARSPSCAPAGPSSSACSGPTAARSPRPPRSCSASWPSPGVYLGLADYVAKEIVEAIL